MTNKRSLLIGCSNPKLRQCETKLISDFRTYQNTKFSTPEFPEFSGTKTGLSKSENKSETETETTEIIINNRNFRKSPKIPVISDFSDFSENSGLIRPEFSFFSDFSENSGQNQTRPD